MEVNVIPLGKVIWKYISRALKRIIFSKSVIPQAIPNEIIHNFTKHLPYKDICHNSMCDNSLRISLEAQLQQNILVNYDKSARWNIKQSLKTMFERSLLLILLC